MHVCIMSSRSCKHALIDSCALACRLVRQDSPLWDALHRGVLTSGSLNAALGFYEPYAAKQLGIPKSFRGHGHLLAAYQNLLLPEYAPVVEEQLLSSSAAGSHAALHSTHAGAAQTSMYGSLIATWNAAAVCEPEPPMSAPASGTSRSSSKRNKQNGKGRLATSGSPAAGSATTASGVTKPATLADAAQLRAAACMRSAARGAPSCSLTLARLLGFCC